MMGSDTSNCSCNNSSSPNTQSRIPQLSCPDQGSCDIKTSLWSSLVASALSVFDKSHAHSDCERKVCNGASNGWASSLKRVVSGGSMRRFHDRMLGTSKKGTSSSNSDIWLLGLCYKVLQESTGVIDKAGLEAFELDFSSRILVTYRKGFDVIDDSRYTTDVNWGCMLRSSQMLVAQALIFHRLGRSWRKSLRKPLDPEYVEILHFFGDSKASRFSIHNLIQSGKSYGLAPGSWVGPYAMCRSWETLSHFKIEENEIKGHMLPMAVYIVSGDEDGERGGAPVVCVEDAFRRCRELSNGLLDWTPILLLVPLVLGLEKINPRYIPSLVDTFTFPQSLGILGGKPGASTYIVGVQDDRAFYLDPHEVQSAVNIEKDNLEADTSSYHCNITRHIPLDSIDSSLAIGFYCRNKGDFDDFCCRASKLSDESNGAPLFTVVLTRNLLKTVGRDDDVTHDIDETLTDDSIEVVTISEICAHEDDWQLL